MLFLFKNNMSLYANAIGIVVNFNDNHIKPIIDKLLYIPGLHVVAIKKEQHNERLKIYRKESYTTLKLNEYCECNNSEICWHHQNFSLWDATDSQWDSNSWQEILVYFNITSVAAGNCNNLYPPCFKNVSEFIEDINKYKHFFEETGINEKDIKIFSASFEYFYNEY
jgi:hypothetical protein